MSQIQPATHPGRQTIAVRPIAVSPRIAGEMLGYGKTTIFRLLKEGELRSFLDGSRRSRRVLVASIDDYVKRKLADTDKS